MALADGGAAGTAGGGVLLWDDNPATLDLLGFDAVAGAVVAALRVPDLDPVTIAIQSPWGGGKSTALQLIAAKLVSQPEVLVIRVDPWEYADQRDVRGTLIAQILSAIGDARPDPTRRERIGELLRRIAWSRVATVLANAVVTANIDVEKMVDAFTPKSEDDGPKSMAGFRAAFAQLTREMGDVARVVVLVDDLDRCLPPAVMQTLEAIKLFLSVPKMAFVLAADQALVREAIAVSVDTAGRSNFADRYLEKIVQLPITLPRLSQDDTETYIGLLLAARRADAPDSYRALVGHVQQRRLAGTAPYLNAPYPQDSHEPSPDDLRLASQLARGLVGDKWSNPRAIKRFLNAWGVRATIAASRGVDIDPQVVLKLYVLEERYPDDFKALITLTATERPAMLRAWENWGREEEGCQRPELVGEDTRAWAATEPSLSAVSAGLDGYLSLAATFTAFSAGGSLSDDELNLVERLAHDSQTVREQAVESVAGRDLPVQRAVVTTLLERLPRFDEPSWAIESACEVAAAAPGVAADVVRGLRTHAWPLLEPSDVATINGCDEATVRALVAEIAGSAELDQAVRDVARDMLTDVEQA